MKVVITGADGQLGRALRATAPGGATIVPLTRRDLDITDARAVARRIDDERPDLIVNAAAYTAVDRAETDRAAAHAVNAVAPGLLGAAAVAVGARFVHVSTDFVFDGTDHSPIKPDAPVRPLGVYGSTKAAGEVAALAHGTLVVRTAFVYGAGCPNFVATMLRLARAGNPIRVVADQIGTPTHAASLARAIWALDAGGATGVHHFTDAGCASWYDLAQAVVEEAAAIGLIDRQVDVVPIATADYPTPAVRPAYSVLDKTATWALIGGPARHWRAELRAMLAEEAASR